MLIFLLLLKKYPGEGGVSSGLGCLFVIFSIAKEFSSFLHMHPNKTVVVCLAVDKTGLPLGVGDCVGLIEYIWWNLLMCLLDFIFLNYK